MNINVNLVREAVLKSIRAKADACLTPEERTQLKISMKEDNPHFEGPKEIVDKFTAYLEGEG